MWPYNILMNVSKQQQDERLRATIPFTEDEQERFRAFLKATGRKAGPFLRIEAMKRVEEYEAITSGKTQIDMDKLEALR